MRLDTGTGTQYFRVSAALVRLPVKVKATWKGVHVVCTCVPGKLAGSQLTRTCTSGFSCPC